METTEKYKQEDASRKDTICPVCGQYKADDIAVCWPCWRDYKYFDGTIEQFKARRKRAGQ